MPSNSMMPTLLTGDFILVNKFDYGLRLPILNSKIIDFSKPERGDVVVFKTPVDNKTDFIKRIVGLPGDKIQVMKGILHINSQPVTRRRLPSVATKDLAGNIHGETTTVPLAIYTSINTGNVESITKLIIASVVIAAITLALYNLLAQNGRKKINN